jgi:GxxExxY protein
VIPLDIVFSNDKQEFRRFFFEKTSQLSMGPPWQFVTSNRLFIAITSANSLFIYCKSPEIKLAHFVLVEASMIPQATEVESLTDRIIGCAIEVHRTLGPGLLESVYRECLICELRSKQLAVESERRVLLEYKGERINSQLKLDLLVEGRIVLELKAVERIHPIHLAQVITYLKLTGYRAGLLMNFNSVALRSGLRRVKHPNLYVKKI